MNNLKTTDYPPFFKTYIDKVSENTLAEALEKSAAPFLSLLNSIDESKGEHKYEEGKWSIKELCLHIVDTERVLSFRAFAFARKDKTNLPEFSENDYTDNSKANQRTLESIVNEYKIVREATLALFKSFDAQTLSNIGTANGGKMTVLSLGCMIVGHQTHHLEILKERYLK